MKKIMIKNLTVVVFIFFFSILLANAQTEEKFEEPDVKDDFCGVHINFQYCRCAFHDEKQHCSAVDLDSWGARIHVMDKFRAWVGDLMEAFARKCLNDGFDWNLPSMTCIHQPPDTKPAGNTLEEQYGLPDMSFMAIPVKPKVAGSVETADGEIFIYMASFKKWKGPIKTGQPIYQGDVIMTTKRGGGTVRVYGKQFSDFAKLGPETYFEVAPPAEPWDPSIFGGLKRGVMEIYDAITRDRPETPTWYHQISTPSVVVGARGTHYLLAYDEVGGETQLFLREGSVEVVPNDGGERTILKPGELYAYQQGAGKISTFDANKWDDVTSEFGLSGERLAATADEPEHLTGDPVDDTQSGPTREELVGDLLFLDDQFDSGKPWLVISAFILALGLGVGYYRLKIQKR